jgi:hypothetical protein
VRLHEGGILARFKGSRKFGRHSIIGAETADGQITAAEILEQENTIIDMLESIEPTLNDEQHAALTKILLEYEVLINMALVHYPSVMDADRYYKLNPNADEEQENG